MTALQMHHTKRAELGNFLRSLCTRQFTEHLGCMLEPPQLRMFASSSFLRNCENLCSAVFQYTPQIGLEHFEKILILILQAIDNSTSPLLQYAHTSLREMYGKVVQTVYESDGVPPDSFRDMPVFPTAADFRDNHIFLRKNLVQGPYSSEEDYLDVQYRLLREDFLKPLRDTIFEIRGLTGAHIKGHDKRWNAVRMYKDVYFTATKDHRASGCLSMVFDPHRELNIEWNVSKRFMTGALLVISNDNFSTLHLARVHRRDLDYLYRGTLPVQVLGSGVAAKSLLRGSFTVGECTTFFEPYYQVLRALQNTRADSFPLARYIVRADCGREMPDYLQPPGNRVYEISLARPGSAVRLDVIGGQWPSPDEMGLNQSQHEAMVGALTQKVMLVQGPPGTGKTFLGLRVVSTLLRNPDAWRFHETGTSPILVVCYTNHALDQFLGGLLNTTDQIVRLGGRCKDDRLQGCILDARVDDLSQFARQRYGKCKREQDRAEKDLQAAQEALCALDGRTGIVSIETLLKHGVLSREQARAVSSMSIWLGEGLDSSDLSEAERMMLNKQISDSNNPHISFEETFSRIQISIDELQKLVRNGHTQFQRELEYCKSRIEFLRSRSLRTSAPRGELQNQNLLELLPEERWQLYEHWLVMLREALKNVERECDKRLSSCTDSVEEVRMMQLQEKIQDKLVVGMTTTKAAGMQKLLHTLRPSIVVVEEAAEVLESHVIAALHPDVKHLLLLGDHKQLRPNHTVHELGVDFQIDISLFERLCGNGMPCKTLNVQHRMRPEIASLIQSIYPGLQNHSTVTSYPSVRGVCSNLFFVDHREREEQMHELMSHSNPHEARFVGALVTYLKLQGYEDNQITVLTAYSGQLVYLRSLVNDFPSLRNVRLCNVDNFQGEECEIIVLSLVRSNPSKTIGFLKTANRVNVALSRAKHGMYIIGDLECLTAKGEVWRDVRAALKSVDAVGPALTLRCTEHPDQALRVTNAADFSVWRRGGCTVRCSSLLGCGHQCPEPCHRDNLEHYGVVCVETCNRICQNGHLCFDLCYKCYVNGVARCRPCQGEITVRLLCSHMAKMKCSSDPRTFLCRVKVRRMVELCGHENVVECYTDGPCKLPCNFELPCGHKCDRKCHKFDDPLHLKNVCRERCQRVRRQCSGAPQHLCDRECGQECPECVVPVRKTLPGCGHEGTFPCAQPPAEAACTAPCVRKLPCGHPCKRRCGESCGGCDVPVDKENPICKHFNEMPCGVDPSQQFCQKKCEKILPCEHKCPKPCRVPCHPCVAKVPKPLPCGHEAEVLCEEDPADVQCVERCPEMLPGCGHRCRSKCGQPCESKCSKLVAYDKHESPCGHRVKVPCHQASDDFSPSTLLSLCKRACSAKLACNHSCKGTCSECHQGRLHRACEEKCNQTLLCGHKCPDKCGRPCLPCKLPCPVTCAHNVRCMEPCGRLCSSCTKKCELGKPVYKCLKKCRELCSWDATGEPCRFSIRKCGHDCIGFQGEPCPALCRLCDAADLGNPSEDQRFVVLPDCQHTVNVKDVEKCIIPTVVGVPVCPVCKTPATNATRFANMTKRTLRHIAVIYKEMAYCDLRDPAYDLNVKLGEAQSADRRNKRQTACIKTASPSTYRLMRAVVQEWGRRDKQKRTDELAAASRSLGTLAAVAGMLDDCLRSSLGSCKTTRVSSAALREEVAGRVEALAAALLARHADGGDWRALDEQEVRDVNAEVMRLQRLQQLCLLEEDAAAAGALQSLLDHVEYRQAADTLRSCRPYPLAAMDPGVRRAIVAQAKEGSRAVTVDWARLVPLPLSAARGRWYTCASGKHPYSKTATDRRCPKCVPLAGGSHPQDAVDHLRLPSQTRLGN